MGNSFTTTTATTPPGYGGITLTEARAVVTQFARNAAGATSSYSAAQIDTAIQFIGNHFARETRVLKQVSATVLTIGDAAVDLTALTGFRPERLLAAYAGTVAEPLDVVPWEDLYRRQTQCPASGPPRMIAFEDWSTAGVYPTPDAAYTLKLRWTPPFTVFTAGTGTPDAVTLNLPADWLAEILPYGPPAVLQHNETEQLYASASWGKYLETVKRIAGEGSLGARSAERENPWRRSCRDE